jgi:hypothetical protein
MAGQGGFPVMIARRMIPLILVVALAGCGARTFNEPIRVTSQFNPDAPYGTFKTWDFAKYKNMPQEGVLSDAAFRLEIANMIENALKQYGLVRVFDKPDLQVGFLVAADQVSEKELEGWFDERDWDMPAYRGNQQDEWRKGSLILMVFEAKSGQLLWRSSAEAILDETATEEQRKQTVQRAIKMMLDELPRESQK